MRRANAFALVLVALAGSVSAAPTVDGVKSPADGYPASPLWLNNIPTGFGNNATGMGSGAAGLGSPNAVSTGMEIAIPFSAIGYSGSGPIKIAAFIADGLNFDASNQFLGGLPLNTPNLGYMRPINLGTFAGDQHITITPTALASAPVIDGTRDAVYGGVIPSPNARLQTNYTGYGKSNHNQVVRGGEGTNNGSEIDNIYVGMNGTTLYIHVGGNLEANYNHLNIFIDADNNAATGQNRLLGGNLRNGDAGAAGPVNNMSDEGTSNGLTFDAGFGPDFFIGINGADTDPAPEVELNQLFMDFCTLPTAGAGTFYFCGSTGYGIAGGTAGAGADAGAPDIRASVNNSNIDGVPGDPVGGSVAAPNVDFAWGSELNGLWGFVDTNTNRLHLMLTGNLERNYNALILFFDVAPGGQNRLRGASRNVVTSQGTVRWRGNVDIDFDNLNDGSGSAGLGADASGVVEDQNNPGTLIMTNGLKFDDDFAADYVIRFANGDNNNDRVMRNFSNAAFLRTGGRSEDFNNRSLDFGAYDGGLKASFNPIVYGGPLIDDFTASDSQTNYAPRLLSAEPQPVADPGAFSGLLQMSINNSNVGGVTGSTADPVAVEAVTTGLELSLDLGEIGWDGTSPIKVGGFIASSNWNFLSNQVIGGLPTGTANLGNARNVNFEAIGAEGNFHKQYVVVPVGGGCPAGCNLADITESGGTLEEPGCPDGQLTLDDILVFIDAFNDATGCPGTGPCNLADITESGGTLEEPGTPDGQLTLDDILVFIDAYNDATGC